MKDVYMQVTQDEYELPLAVADSVNELARLTGKKATVIRSCIINARKKGYKSQYVKVECEE